jgi:uncharacterized protein (TIGR02145 family)
MSTKIFSILGALALFVLVLVSVFILSSCEDINSYSPVVFETDSVKDIDGNIYKTVKIGEQWWMLENLKVTRYRNGDSIAFVDLSKSSYTNRWKNLGDTGAFCVLGGEDSTKLNYKGKQYGYLYNYNVITDSRGIAPDGWHIPSDEEWKQLEMQLGMSQDEANKVNWRGDKEGNKLKLQSGWYKNQEATDQFEVWGSNESGFTAIGSSCVMFDGSPGEGVTFTGFWWTSTNNNNQAWYRYLDYQKANVFRYYGPFSYGFSIRCIKD